LLKISVLVFVTVHVFDDVKVGVEQATVALSVTSPKWLIAAGVAFGNPPV
jgi:hypothetical protein